TRHRGARDSRIDAERGQHLRDRRHAAAAAARHDAVAEKADRERPRPQRYAAALRNSRERVALRSIQTWKIGSPHRRSIVTQAPLVAHGEGPALAASTSAADAAIGRIYNCGLCIGLSS